MQLALIVTMISMRKVLPIAMPAVVAIGQVEKFLDLESIPVSETRDVVTILLKEVRSIMYVCGRVALLLVAVLQINGLLEIKLAYIPVFFGMLDQVKNLNYDFWIIFWNLHTNMYRLHEL